ncbi:hypothetical protein ACOSQ4_005190 [Xanthoceras sorbifolium]
MGPVGATKCDLTQAKEKEGTDVVIKSRAQPQHGVEMCSSSASSMRQSFVSQVVDSGEKISTAEKGKVSTGTLRWCNEFIPRLFFADFNIILIYLGSVGGF